MPIENKKLIELEELLANASDTTERIDLINKYSWDLSRLIPTEAIHLAERAFSLSKAENDEARKASSLRNMAHCLRLLSRFALALEKGLQGLAIARGLNN